MNRLKTSVVMTTYNGEEYLKEQLDSLRTQTKTIDEVLIFDDGSTDATCELIKSYIKEYTLENWCLYRNEVNKGWKKNFFDGINQASGDVIFPCDQDDIWLQDKVETMMDCFQKNEDIDVLVGRYDKVFMKKDEHRSIGNCVSLAVDRLSDIIYRKNSFDGKLEQAEFNNSFLHVEPGCCLALKKDFVYSISKYWIPDLGHDSFYIFFSEAKGSYYLLNKTVIKWRQHFGSTSRPITRKKITRLREIECNDEVLSMMGRYIKENDINSEKREKIILKASEWNRLRKDFVTAPTVLKGLGLLKYIRFYERYRAYITDWIYAYMKA